ncbi:MAG: TonB C-terminal domain-containing protein [Xanthomonadales bacterium]|nr:TonB C-terminal domain-containing protein [Xanthomonadales bacterium]MCP5476205.1 TonB C-terminal domain-containing protein [Rhodanobacteraceae bacterium]
MESAADRTRALVYAIGVHVLAALIMFAGLFVSAPKKPVIAGGALEAVLVDMNLGRPLPKPATRPTPKPEPPKPVPKPEPAPPPPPPAAKPDDVTDQRPTLPTVPDQNAMNLERQKEQLRKQQEEQRRQQEIEKQRMQQLEDIRKQRAEAARLTQEREKQLAQAREAQRAQEILTQPATREPEGQQRPGQDAANDLLSQYAGLIQEVVTQNWRRPANTPPGIRCVLKVRQIPGGEVIGVSIGSPCNANPLIQQSIIQAVERASPLPYMGFEAVFQPALNFNFRYDG